jgi:flagellin
MVSVNTNYGALIALQNLNATQSQLATTQQRISTGLAVSSAKDNGGIYAIAQNLRADVGSLAAVTQSLDRANSSVDVAISAGQSVSDLLVEMKQKAIAAADGSQDAASRSALNEDFKSLRDQIQTVVDNAAFNGVNLLDGTNSGSAITNIQALADAKQSSHITVNVENLSYGGGTLTITKTQQIDTQANASTTAASIDTSLANVNKALARLGTASKKLSLHETFVKGLSDALNKGIGNLVDADLPTESAKLQSLQVKQQLGVQALSIANQAPQILLSLFR